LHRLIYAVREAIQQRKELRFLISLCCVVLLPFLLIGGALYFDRLDSFSRDGLHAFGLYRRRGDGLYAFDGDLNGDDMFANGASKFMVAASAMRLVGL
jgi:hypothetical protein